MIQVYAAIAILLFGAGGIAGWMTIIAIGIRLDGKRRMDPRTHNSLTISSPNRIAVSTRAWNGVRSTPRITVDLPRPAGPPSTRQRSATMADHGSVM